MWSNVGCQNDPLAMATQAARLLMDCEAAFSEAAKNSRAPAAPFNHWAQQASEHLGAWQGLLAEQKAPAAQPSWSAKANAFKGRGSARFGRRVAALAMFNNGAAMLQAYTRLSRHERAGPQVQALAQKLLPDARTLRQGLVALCRGKEVP